jgi:hypothetical protein
LPKRKLRTIFSNSSSPRTSGWRGLKSIAVGLTGSPRHSRLLFPSPRTALLHARLFDKTQTSLYISALDWQRAQDTDRFRISTSLIELEENKVKLVETLSKSPSTPSISQKNNLIVIFRHAEDCYSSIDGFSSTSSRREDRRTARTTILFPYTAVPPGVQRAPRPIQELDDHLP